MLHDSERTAKPIGSKILIVGCCGSGKSTLARKLQERTGLPLVHLDMIFWRPDGTHISREAFDRRLDELLRGEGWIIDGNYSRTYAVKIRACDTVIFLDYDEETCMGGLIQRIGQRRPDIPWVEERLEPELVEMVQSFRQESRPKLLEILEQYPDKQLIRFSDREEAEAWLNSLP